MIDYSHYYNGGLLSSLFTRTNLTDALQLDDTIGVVEFLSKAGINQATEFSLQFTQFGAASYNAHYLSLNNFAVSGWIDPMATINQEVAADPVIYPNPASQSLTVKTFVGGEKTFEITDVTGRKLRMFRSASATIHVPVDNLENGTYFLKMISGVSEKVAKFTVN